MSIPSPRPLIPAQLYLQDHVRGWESTNTLSSEASPFHHMFEVISTIFQVINTSISHSQYHFDMENYITPPSTRSHFPWFLSITPQYNILSLLHALTKLSEAWHNHVQQDKSRHSLFVYL